MGLMRLVIESKAFESTIAAPSQGVTSSSGLTIKADIDFKTVSLRPHSHVFRLCPIITFDCCRFTMYLRSFPSYINEV